MEPPELVVAVEVGGSQQLTCRVACADPAAASVQWRGLDTSLGAVQSGAGSSVLSVRNASLAAAGIRVCVGSCGNSTFQRTVELLVFCEPRRPSRICTPGSPASPLSSFAAASSPEPFGIAHPAPAPCLRSRSKSLCRPLPPLRTLLPAASRPSVPHPFYSGPLPLIF